MGRSDAGGDEWLLTDRLGSVRDVVGSAGTLVLDHAEYQAFGGVASDTNAAAAGKYGSEGEREDRTTGLLQSGGTRVDDTQTHQWMQEDPTGFDAGDANLRRVVGNDPTNATDPTGLLSIELESTPNAGKQIVWSVYQGAWGSWSRFTKNVGNYDPKTGKVWHHVAGGSDYRADLEEVKKYAASCSYGADWDYWFRYNGTEVQNTPVENVVPPGNAPLIQQWQHVDPQFKADFKQGFAHASVLANVAVQWDGNAWTFISPGGEGFVFQGGKWRNAAGIEASEAEATAANRCSNQGTPGSVPVARVRSI